MSVEVTPEMRVALDMMRRAGLRVHQTEQRALDCGCWVAVGFRTDTYEPCLGMGVCSPSHRVAAEISAARWDQPDVQERFLGMSALDAMVALFEAEIAE